MKIVFQWHSNMWTFNQTPAAIDNVNIFKYTCNEPSGLAVSNIQLDEASVTWNTPSSSNNFELFLGLDTNYPLGQTGVVSINGANNHTFLNLLPSTYYYVWYRTVCSSTDKSYWVGPVKFMTKCGVLPTPFYETFDTTSLSFECWEFLNTLPQNTNVVELSTNYKMDGDRGLHYRSFASGEQHDLYLITPKFNLNGGIYKLTYYYKTSPSGNNEFEVVLAKNDKKPSDFTNVLLPKKIYQASNYVKETVFFKDITGEAYLAWHINTVGSATFSLENVRLESVVCTEPLNLEITSFNTNTASFKWNDAIASEWEYAIVPATSGQPTIPGISVNQTNAIATLDVFGQNLTADTDYDFYVRSKCTDGSWGPWSGPLKFQTACDPFSIPYKEGFDTQENNLGCWTILDSNKDASGNSGKWSQSQWTVHEGDRCMFFSAYSPSNDDWLVSPGLNMNGGLYAVTFYYQLSQNSTANVEVKLSTTGISPAAFTQTIGTTLPYKGAVYTKKVVYVEGVVGVANIGFHVTGKGGSIQIDTFSVEQVTCRSVEDIEATKIGTTTVDIKWKDDTNNRWEYYVMVDDGANSTPSVAGSLSTTNNASLTRVNGTNALLQPNSEYKVFVRSNCGTGKYSEWIGPLKFRTACEIMPIPYQEGFNTNSVTQYCWKILDGNNDKPWYGGFGEWFTTDAHAYEGDKAMYFTNMDSTNDDWLMSPTFKFDKTKMYRITYMYRTEPGVKAEFEFRMSNSGREKADYKKILLANNVYDNVPWKKHKFILSNIDDEVSFAFYVSDFKNWGSRVYIDNFRIEEITNCAEPLTQGAKNITGTSADIFWDNDFGNTDWEYFVRKKAFLVAPPLGSGTTTKTNTVNVTKDNFGDNLVGNTWYEFYVRSLCTDGSKTEWTGPFYFRTDCTYFTLPYWEGFNGDDNSLRCWTMTTGDGKASLWKQRTTNLFEGSHSMNYTQTTVDVSNDWFISPLFKNLDPTKTYRVKFNYKGTGTGNNEMTILASNKGTAFADFTTVIAPKTSYTTSVFKDAIYYFTGISGDMHLAFNVVGDGAKNITIDNLFIDEVVTCGQPLHLGVKNIQPTSVDLFWQDAFNATEWEYYIQETKQIPPTSNDVGVSTLSKDFTATKDINGNNLKQNTDYVYYVRTVCGNDKFSDWSGPISFTTACGIYTVPFVEGFNTNTKGLRCWTIVNGPNATGTTRWTPNSLWAKEGDQLIQYSQTGANTQADAYLISPTIQFNAGTNYVLKYYYKTNLVNVNEFEVLLSQNGIGLTNFTTTLLSKKAYTNDNYVQETIFISGISGNVNIAWHALAKGAMTLDIDYVIIEKAGSCPEPTNVQVTDYTANTIDVEWTQAGGITQWEVFVVEYGMPIPAGATGVIVTGTPQYTATGLTSGKAYHVYVRAKCTGAGEMSNWSTPADGSTEVSVNGDCTGAIQIPVNTGSSCIQKIGVSTSKAPEAANSSKPGCMSYLHTNEMWFEFTALSSTHLIAFDNVINVDKLETPAIAFAVYSGSCTNMQLVECFDFESSYGGPLKDDRASTVSGLTPGNKYYLRVMLEEGNYLLNICITTSEYNYVSVSKNGGLYTTDELVKEVLIQSDCDLVSNVIYKSGPNLGGNSLGYFNKNGSTFPFEEGIVLATHDIANTPGPYYDHGDAGGWTGVRGMIPPWEGDEDLNAVIESAGGSAYGGTKSVSTLEFDFIPITNTVKFEYLMAMSYLHNCTVVCWGAGALFTAWLTELETGQGQNLALVPGTNEPITLSTVRDTQKSGAMCESVHPEFFGQYYGNGQDDPLLAPVNYVGLTKPMSSEAVQVKPGVKYRIKLAMADFCNTNHVSAVFFNAKSFDLGALDLGPDLTIEANTAICDSESKIIKTDLPTENVQISWFRDELLIPGEQSPNLEVREGGNYKVVAKYTSIDCEVVGEVLVEMFVPLKEIIKPSNPINYCRFNLNKTQVDLTIAELSMFVGLDRTNYNVVYYNTYEDAVGAKNAIVNSSTHEIESSADKQTRYIFVQDIVTGCSDIFTVDLFSEEGEKPNKPHDVKVCGLYELPVLADDLSYYSGSGATGKKYLSKEQITVPGTHTMYVLKDNGNGCYEETSFTISITEEVIADVLEDKSYDCEVHVLEDLNEGNKYFTEPGGNGIRLLPGQLILDNQTIYIYKESEDRLCYDESSFTITYEDCPIPKGISPNGDGYNDTFDLSSNGVSSIKIYNRLGSLVYEYEGIYTDQWYGKDKNNKQLPSGTYYYVLVTRSGLKTGWVQVNY